MRDIIRLLIAPWYLLGWVSHVYLGLNNPEIYRPFGQTTLIPAFTSFWYNVVMPQIIAYALLLAAFEVVVGILLISKERWVKIGLVLSITFNLFLIQLGLSYPAPDGISDFLVNRLPNLIFIVLQIPLFWGQHTTWLPVVIRDWLRRLITVPTA
jgi:hypothetical protein